MILRHGKCIGFRLFRLGRKQLEIWFAPKNEKIERHIHQNMDSKITLLAGNVLGCIGNRLGTVRRFSTYSVPAGIPHEAYAVSACLFLNLETWKSEISSACIDFESV